MPTIEDSTWAVKPPAVALEAGALCLDGLGLLTVVIEEGDERGRPTMRNAAACAPGGNGGAVADTPMLVTNRRDWRESLWSHHRRERVRKG